MAWVPLHVHSQYSILDATCSIEALVKKAVSLGLPALALTDQGNMYGAVEFFKACKAAGIRPILGCELFCAPTSRFEKKRTPGLAPGYSLLLLAKDATGYKNLCKLSSLAHLEGFYYTPRIDKDLLAKYSEGLICLSGPVEGFLGRFATSGKEEELLSEIQWFQSVFKGDFFLEVQRHLMLPEDVIADKMDQETWVQESYQEHIKQQEKLIALYKSLSKKLGVGCVATHGSHYIERGDWKAHEILMNIQSGEPCEIWERDSQGNPKRKILNPKRRTSPSHALHFKSPEEMRALFSDFPEAVDLAQEIANRCTFELDFKSKYYPVFIPPSLEGRTFSSEERIREAEKFLRDLCFEGIKKRYGTEQLKKVQEKYPTKDPLEVVKTRLKGELDLILSKGMGDYLLIVYDFIAWAKRQGIPMGPGRGSGAGSIILYLIGITDIEPLRFNLFFERFINPERISYPDIDVDICMERRSEVIDYTVQKYGKEKVAQIITFGTMKAKMAIKDVGRVLSVPLSKVNAIAKLVPEDPTMTIEKALELDPEFKRQYEVDEEVRQLIDIAKILEGSVRNTGIHAAGLIISADPIMDRIPVCTAKDTEIMATQFSMKPVESVGMLKIDFLGLKTLTSIQRTVEAIKAHRGKEVDWVNLPLDDKATFNLLNQGKTLGIFQVESGGMQELVKQLHVDKFEEIIAVGALYRPGPMEMIPSFVARKHGKEPIEIEHPLMKDVLEETYGIMVYQEQVMQIASLLANYSLGEGDVLRRAMGKKDREEMARQREKFRTGALKKGIDEHTAMLVFDKIEKFASYGFNKSHAAAYGFLTYVTAYLKANYPGEWMAALMTSDRDDISKISKIIHECQEMNIAILPPDVNESGTEFVATAQGIRFAMTAIKGVGEGVVDAILSERQAKGPFKSLYDFFKRVDMRKVGKKTIEHLIEAGCFDFTKWSRQALIECVDPLHVALAKQQQEEARGVMNFFDLIEDDLEKRFLQPPQIKTPVSKQSILKRENELLGFYLTGHPLNEFKRQMQELSCIPLSRISEMDDGSVLRAAFIIETCAVKVASKSQRKFAVLLISDGEERFELPVWPDMFEEKNALLSENQLIFAVLQVEMDEGNIKLQCRWLGDLTKADAEMQRACDNAYDRAKLHTKMQESREARSQAAKGKEMKKEAPTQLTLRINADQARFSHIVELKKLLRKHAGAAPVNLEFYSEEKKVASIDIASEWGVEPSEALERALKACSVLVAH